MSVALSSSLQTWVVWDNLEIIIPLAQARVLTDTQGIYSIHAHEYAKALTSISGHSLVFMVTYSYSQVLTTDLIRVKVRQNLNRNSPKYDSIFD